MTDEPTLRTITYKELMELERERQRGDHAAVDAFIEAVRTANLNALAEALRALEYCYKPWPHIVSAVEHLNPPAKFRRHCLQIWLSHGDHFRGQVNKDLLLVKLLRVLLPKYKGPAKVLYRGESFQNRRYRTYGCSWSTDVEIARAHANGLHCMCQGGSVVLRTCAPVEAIVCAPKVLDNRYAEDEVVVDRRQLRRVEVVERIAQLSWEEYQQRPRYLAPAM